MATTDSDILNYRGELFAIGAQQAPFLAAIAPNAIRTSTFTFPIAVPWATAAAAQTTQSEDTAAAEGTPTTTTLAQDVNVCQIQKYDVESTLKKQSTSGQFSGVNANGFGAGLSNLEFQKLVGLRQLALDANYSFIQGSYTAESTAATNTTTRGLKNAITTNTVAAGGLKLSKKMIEEVIREMVASGALWGDVAFLCNVFNFQMLSDIYGNPIQSRTEGGLIVSTIYVAGGPSSGIKVLMDTSAPTDEVYLTDLALCKPVFCPVPASLGEENESASYSEGGLDVAYYKKGILAAKKGGFLYMQIGLDYGAEEMHGSITGTATTA